MVKKYGFRRWLHRWLNRPFEDNEVVSSSKVRLSTRDDDGQLSSDPLRMNIYSASGGFIIETRTYDRHKDRNNTNLYIVNDGNDLGEEIGKIITMASLSR